MTDLVCRAKDCLYLATVRTAVAPFCAIHYNKWKAEVIAAGGSDRELQYELLQRCHFCLEPKKQMLDHTGRCVSCAKACAEYKKDYKSKRYHDSVDHPHHYTEHPSGVECIAITEHMGFCLGNAIKYLWRAEHKGGIEDLEKARWYITREIERKKAND